MQYRCLLFVDKTNTNNIIEILKLHKTDFIDKRQPAQGNRTDEIVLKATTIITRQSVRQDETSKRIFDVFYLFITETNPKLHKHKHQLGKGATVHKKKIKRQYFP